MTFPPRVRVTFATDASERLRCPWPTVEAWRTSAVTVTKLLGSLASASRRDTCLAPPVLSRAPVSDRTIVCGPRGGGAATVACTTVAWPLKAVLADWAALCAGQNSRLIKRRLIVAKLSHHEPLRCIHALALIE